MSDSSTGKWFDFLGWLLFVAWVAAAHFSDALPKGSGAIGVGLIVVMVASMRYFMGRSFSIMWVAIGAVFIIAGIAEFIKVGLPVRSIALIVCGLLIFLSGYSKKRRV